MINSSSREYANGKFLGNFGENSFNFLGNLIDMIFADRFGRGALELYSKFLFKFGQVIYFY